MLNEVKNSIKNNLLNKLVSPFYGAFIISWLIWNWEILYATIFVDPELLWISKGLLKLDYILSFYPPEKYIVNIIFLAIGPLLSSYIAVFIFPMITKRFYKKSLESEAENINIKTEIEQGILKKKGEKLAAEEKILIKESSVKDRKKEEIKSQGEEWGKEFNDFKKHPLYPELKKMVDVLYGQGGKTYTWRGSRYIRNINQDMIAIAHTKGLININNSGDPSNEIFELTEKGKYFINMYLNDPHPF